jgi:Flp pilus assembly pilin Flp
MIEQPPVMIGRTTMKAPLQALTLVRAFSARTERGASAVEYALLVGLIAAVIIFAVSALGMKVADLYNLPWP